MILSWAISAALFLAAAPFSSVGEKETVTINILSKQIRLIREGGAPLNLQFPPAAAISGPGFPPRCPVKSIELADSRGALTVRYGPNRFLTEGVYLIESPAAGSRFTCVINSIERSYPLPAEITISSGTLTINVTENIHNYALHSAGAEMGFTEPEGQEALFAVALLIDARARQPSPHAPAGYDFCDLTHCQHYYGLPSSLPRDQMPRVLISRASMSSEPLFHSCCGGHTLGDRVFSLHSSGTGVRDRLFRENLELCRGKDSQWEREIRADKLSSILFAKSDPEMDLLQDSQAARISAAASGKITLFPSEEFRLKINRVLGWSFLRSNNSSVQELNRDGHKYFIFRGQGLGHGTGLCQKGALELSRRGFSRYEIIEHYFPPAEFQVIDPTHSFTPHFSYMTFDLNTGRVISSSSSAFSRRKIAPGSIFKLFTSLYLIKNRPDLFSGHEYNCRGREKNPKIHDRCWQPQGHGNLKISRALSSSCNLYFSSLNLKIDKNDFIQFYNNFCSDIGIDSYIKTVSASRWIRFPAGLDDSLMLSAGDYAKLGSFIFAEEPADPKIISVRGRFSAQGLQVIRSALDETFLTGTASGKLKPFKRKINSQGLSEYPLSPGLRGKTSTCVDGTNTPVIYGAFLGSREGRGIFGILHHGNGHLASRWCDNIMRP